MILPPFPSDSPIPNPKGVLAEARGGSVEERTDLVRVLLGLKPFERLVILGEDEIGENDTRADEGRCGSDLGEEFGSDDARHDERVISGNIKVNLLERQGVMPGLFGVGADTAEEPNGTSEASLPAQSAAGILHVDRESLTQLVLRGHRA